ncbi:M23 family metallopeptidase [Marinisporobacter balticus]|uniref:Murein DD-endopeptidase MepM/ murein hydrolase activator NlpD n=1 Tax=Marinisporobacter balticus TaxID=2018667 RepID=A0A4R2KZJ9_9FIRM|nr:M23 family metallopeptidase [Marinisporobacter balticus]TCO79363.1 murein DD-endopeptidase MepM/ murein hydrolase activator NlpD [Marinisporobacter balticus]
MDFYEKFKKLADESLHIMIVPHSGQSIRQLKFKRIILYFSACFMVILCITLIFLIFSTIHLNQQLAVKTHDLSRLQEINTNQSTEINNLKNKTNEVSEKLSILNELESQVRNLVGLKNKTTSSVSKPVSRSAIRNHFLLASMDNAPSNEETNVQLKILAAEMDVETKNLNNLIQDVTNQLKFLDAKPNKKPISGKITSNFGYRINPITHRSQFHKGLDIANKQGTDIVAAGTGIVTFSGWQSGYGNSIVISHGYGYRSVYAHNKENIVNVGQKVKKGDIIAKLGSTGRSTGPHVHFEVQYKGEQIDPQKVLTK